MIRTHKILLAALALILAITFSAPAALAESGVHIRTLTVPHAPSSGATPLAAVPDIQQGPVAMGPTPPVTGVVNGVQTGPPSWPCFGMTGQSPCNNDPAGGYLAALPEEVFTIATCESAYNTNNGTGGCGELWWTFEVANAVTCPTAGCPLSVAITAKQGTNTVYSLPLTNIGTIPAPSQLTPPGPYTEVIYGQQGLGLNWSPAPTVNPAAGNVTFTVTTQVTVGTTTTTKVTAKGTLVVYVM